MASPGIVGGKFEGGMTPLVPLKSACATCNHCVHVSVFVCLSDND